jgi:hypothetical protein
MATMRDTSVLQTFRPSKTSVRVSGGICGAIGLIFFAFGVLLLCSVGNARDRAIFGLGFAGIAILALAEGVWLFTNASRFWISLDDEKVVIATGRRRKIIPYDSLREVTRGVDDLLLVYRTCGNYRISDFYFSGSSAKDAFVCVLSSKLSEAMERQF